MAKGLLEGGNKAVGLEDLSKPQQLSRETVAAPQEPAPAAEEPQPTEPTPEEPKVETPPEPTPEEPKVEEPKEPEVQEPEEPKAPDPVEQIQKSGLNLEFLQELTGKTFESEDQVKEALTKPTMETEYEELKSQHDDLSEKYDLLADQLDPLKYFSEEALKIEMYKQENPKRDASIIQKVFSTEDLSSVDDLEMVKMGIKFKTTKLKSSDQDLEAALAEEFGVEPDTPFNEWSPTAKTRLAIKAGDYRDEFDGIKSSVKLPDRINIEELRSQQKQAAEEASAKLTEDWTKNAGDVLKASKKIQVPIGTPKEGEAQQFFEWDLGKAPEAEIKQLRDDYITMGLPYDDQTKESFQKALDLSLLDQNLPQIMKKYGEDLLARQEEKHLKETHNAEPLHDTQRPEDSKEDQQIKDRTTFVTGGGGAIRQKPLFKQ
jgi:hypothetical protein